jgi:hypothetical protein
MFIRIKNLRTMDSKLIKILVVTLLICSSSCSSLKRYNSLNISGIDSSLADIDLFGSGLSQPVQDNKVKTLWDLSADAQSQFIKILNTRYPDNDKFLSSISNEYVNNEKKTLPENYIRKDLRLVFSVSKKRNYAKPDVFHKSVLSQADRLEYLKISVNVKDTCLKFRGWNKYSTEFGSIDIGDVSFNRSLNLSASASVTGKKDGSDFSAESGTSLSSREDQKLKFRYIMLNGRLSDNVIEMEEEGTREIDLTGNIIAEVSVEFESASEIVSKIKGLKDSSGVFNQSEKLSLNTIVVDVPGIAKIKEGIEADLRMDFVYRNVKRGRKTFPEWDDRVKYYTGSIIKPVFLLTDRDYVPGFCSIGLGQGGNKKEFLTLRKWTGESCPLVFLTYDEAADFYDWLSWFFLRNGDKPLTIGGYNIQFRGKDLTSDLINRESLFGIIPYYW